MKRCSKCGEVKGVGEFHKDRNKASGRRSRCKQCAIEYTKKYYLNNKRKLIAGVRRWEENNRERAMEINRSSSVRWRENNKDKRKEIVTAWRENNKDKIRETSKVRTENLANSYVKWLLVREGVCKEDVSHELMELKRQHVIAKRLIREAKRRVRDESDHADV